MPRMRWASRSGWNGSRPSVRSPVPMKLIGRPVTLRMLSAAPPRASPSILVSTRPVIGRRWWKASATRDRVLAGHGVDHQQRLGGRDGAGDAHQLVHHRLVHVQAAGGVEQDHVVPALPGGLQAGARHLQRGRADRPGVDLDPDVVAQLHELVDRGGAVHVGGHQQRLVAILAQPDRQLGGGGRLARALQPDQHHHRRLGVELQLVALAAQHLDQLVVHDLDDLLAGLDAVEHVGADAPSRARSATKVLDDLVVDVGLQQGKPDLAQGDVKVGLGDLGLAAQADWRWPAGARRGTRTFSNNGAGWLTGRRRDRAVPRRLPILGVGPVSGNDRGRCAQSPSSHST